MRLPNDNTSVVLEEPEGISLASSVILISKIRFLKRASE
jgi:hypothetical protein